MTIPEIENGVQTTNTLSNNLGAKITKFGIGGIYVAMTIIYLWFGGMKRGGSGNLNNTYK